MKKIILASLLLTSISVFAADSATITLNGSVVSETSLELRNSVSNDLAVDVNIISGENGKVIGTAVETSNNYNGYSVSVKSQNGGLKHNDGAQNFGYKFTYGDRELNINNTNAQEASSMGNLLQKTVTERQMKISLEAQENAPSGSYSDVLDLTISAP